MPCPGPGAGLGVGGWAADEQADSHDEPPGRFAAIVTKFSAGSDSQPFPIVSCPPTGFLGDKRQVGVRGGGRGELDLNSISLTCTYMFR